MCIGYKCVGGGVIQLMMSHATFSKGHSSYLIGKLNWTPLPFEAKKSGSVPSKRYLHSGVVHEQRLYILGGIDNESDMRDSKLYCLQLQGLKWSALEGRSYCESRNGHACALFRNELYFFGGSQQQSTPTNDFFKFTPATAAWALLEADSAPCERELALLASLNDEFLLLYGGIDIIEDRIFDDAYLFKNDRWLRLSVAHNPSPRIRMGLAVCGRRLFLFGGEGPGEEGGQLHSALLEAAVNEYDLELSFREAAWRGRAPAGRTAHGMVGVSERFFLVYGGEGAEGGVLGDIWVYDVEELQWAEIETLYGTLTPRCEFSLALHRNELLIFGGLNEEHAVLDDLARLEFLEEGAEPRQLCEVCEQQLEARTAVRPLHVLEPSLSSGFYYNLALELALPFQAVEMVCEAAQELRSPWIRLSSCKTVEEFDYLVFEFAGEQLGGGAFLELAGGGEGALEGLKAGGLRLGRTVLYIEASEEERKVLLLSADSKYSPNFEEAFVQYCYVEEVGAGRTHYGASFGDKQAIYNILKSQLEDPYCLLARSSGSLLAVFQINILPTVEKAYYYELIFYAQPESDVRLYHNEKKSELLESLGYSLTALPDFSLRSYLQLSRLARSIRPFLNSDEQPVPLQDYLQHLEVQRQAGVVRGLEVGRFASALVERCALFECVEGQFLEGNQGVLVYCGNYLVDRYDCPLGQLLSDKFYKKKYSRRSNLFRFAGLLFLSPALPLNRARTRPLNRFRYNEVMEELTSKLKGSGGRQEENEFSQLYNRLILSKESSKKVKRDS